METDVSVVIPTRNRRALLRRALKGVLEQTGIDVEVVVIDEGSSDGTPDEVAGWGDTRVRLVRHEVPRGLPGARNVGLALVSTTWVAFTDDDDLWAPDKLAAQLEALNALPGAEWCAVGAVAVNSRLRLTGPAQVPPPGPDAADLLLARNAIPGGGSGVLARTALVRDAGGFDERLACLEDWDLWVRLALRAPMAAVARPLVAYLVDPRSMSHDTRVMAREWGTVAAKHRGAREARGVTLAEASWLKYLGANALRAGRRVDAARVHARLAREYGPRRAWLLAAAGLVVPGLQARRDRKAAAAMPPAWRQEAESWLGRWEIRP